MLRSKAPSSLRSAGAVHDDSGDHMLAMQSLPFGFQAATNRPMKKLLLGSLLAAFASVSAVQAGEDTTKAKAAAPTVKAASSCEAKSGCCADKAVVAKKADVSVRGATLLVRK
jgi:hypothetical protein